MKACSDSSRISAGQALVVALPPDWDESWLIQPSGWEWLFANALALAAITTMVSAIAQPCAAVVFPETAASMAEQWGLRDRAGLTTARAFANAACDGRLR